MLLLWDSPEVIQVAAGIWQSPESEWCKMTLAHMSGDWCWLSIELPHGLSSSRKLVSASSCGGSFRRSKPEAPPSRGPSSEVAQWKGNGLADRRRCEEFVDIFNLPQIPRNKSNKQWTGG